MVIRNSYLFITNHKILVGLTIFYFLLRLTNLTLLPIFNDEAIYLDWGWVETEKPGFLFYSLYDAKQPFLMWLFGISQRVFSDPLFAGRFVSVCFGFLTMGGIYKIGKQFFTQKDGYLAAFLYSIIPLFSYYDRQALMESSIAAVGVLSCYTFLRLIETERRKYSIFLGILFGVGYFIKSSMLIFVASYVLLSLYLCIAKKQLRKNVLKHLMIVFLLFFITDLLLFIQPQFWETLHTNSRYSLTIFEILSFPIHQWSSSFFGYLLIAFWYTTPLIFFLCVLGIIKSMKQKNQTLLVLWFFVSLVLHMLLVRSISHRYIVSFLPYVTLFSGFTLLSLTKKWKRGGFVLLLVAMVVPLGLTIVQISNPEKYFSLMSRVTSYSENVYTSGFSGGRGVAEIVAYLNKEVEKKGKIFITMAINTGNPETAIKLYFQRNEHVRVVYLDSQLFTEEIYKLDCITSKIPVYFISRDSQQANLNKFLEEIHRVDISGSNNSIGIYTLKRNCKGEFLEMNPMLFQKN